MPKQVAIVFTKGEQQSLQAFRKSVRQVAEILDNHPEYFEAFKEIERKFGVEVEA